MARRSLVAGLATPLAALVLAAPAGADPTAAGTVAALVHHPVATKIEAAQQKFDEGLTLLYAFNREEAARRFQAAAAADPHLAMAWWGVAMAAGPNINFPMSAERVKTAHDALAKAKALESEAAPEEKRLIDAVALRYPATYASEEASRPGYVAYRDAMATVHADYPADNDAAVLYVESVFDTGDIDWNAGKPTPDAALVAGILEGVLKREPGHVGANHFYVHACDFIGVAERALPSARRLSALPAETAASHLVHMSGHIYLDLGMFEDLERDNRTAVDDDRAFALSSGAADPWNLDYFGHNLDFYLGGATMLGDRPNIDRALDIARTGQGRGSYGLALARRRDWDGVLAWPQAPSAPLWQRLIATYARGLASSERGDAAQARAAEAALEAGRATPGFTGGVATNLADLLGARLAHAAGDDDDALTRLRRVQAAVQPLPPEVFAPWYFPVGEWIGSILLARGDAAGAEAAYRADLQRTPNNARALYGLMQSLSRQQRTAEARPLAAQIAANWRGTYEDLRPSF